jgi:shikimate kinase
MKDRQNIFLCGFMGCGKTTLGRLVAEKSGLPFIDSDEYIVSTQMRSVAEIFAEYGESHFRRLESEAILHICKTCTDCVTALGGGAVINPANAELINQNGISFFLDVDFETCYERIKSDPTRPLAKSRESLRRLYDERKPIYLKHCKFTIERPEQIYDYL